MTRMTLMTMLSPGQNDLGTDFIGILYLIVGLLLAVAVAFGIPYLSRRASQRREIHENP